MILKNVTFYSYTVCGQPNVGVANTRGFGNLPDLGVPNATTSDGPAGIRINRRCGVFTTGFPCPNQVACTWDPEIARAIGEAGAKELKENNMAAWLTPVVGMKRGNGRTEKGRTMIIDSLDNAYLYKNIHKDFPKVFEVLRRIAEGEVSERTVLEEGRVWVSAPVEAVILEGKRQFEAHRDSIDIHYILSGAEEFGYAKEGSLTTTKEYDQKEDYLLLDGKTNLVALNAGDFCITFPQDAHIPTFCKIGEDKLQRVVAKIQVCTKLRAVSACTALNIYR